MKRNDVMKNLQKELLIQEKLKNDIIVKKNQLKNSKKQAAMYKKWLKKLDQLEINQNKRKREIDEKMQEALLHEKEQYMMEHTKKASADKEPVVMQRLFEVEGENTSSEKGL